MQTTTLPQVLPFPKYVWLLILTYSMLTILATWFNKYSITLFAQQINAGELLLPVMAFIAYLITAVYGFKYFRLTFWCGCLFNNIFILYGIIVVHLNNPSYSSTNFDGLIQNNLKTLLITNVIYFSSQPLIAYLAAKLKILLGNNYLHLRILITTSIGVFIGYSLFLFFSGYLTNDITRNFFFFSCLILLSIPLISLFIKKLQRSEDLNILDTKTNFNLFHLETVYTDLDNCFYGKQLK